MLPLVSLVFAMDFDTAVAELRTPATWCAGAAALAAMRDERALAALLDAYARPIEASKVCLLEAVEQLARGGAVEALLSNGDVARALRAMSLCADDRWIPLLEAEVGLTRATEAALDVMRLQRRTEAWEAACVRLLNHPAPDVRVAVAALLAHRSATREAVSARLQIETDIAVIAALNAALAPA